MYAVAYRPTMAPTCNYSFFHWFIALLSGRKYDVLLTQLYMDPGRLRKEYGRVQTRKFTRRANRSRTVRVGLPVYTLRPLRRVRPAHSDHIRRCSQWTRTVRVGLALQCECSSGLVGRVGYASDASSAHVCLLTYVYPL